jgi:APA family basic amino acid/polyamine antiporter
VTTIKLAVVLFFIFFGVFFIKVSNWVPFIPPPSSASASGGGSDVWSTPLLQLILGIQQHSFGFSGIITGAATVFFAYIGFDIVATAAEETRKPQRDLPIGILGSLLICTILYIAVSLVMTGIVPYKQLNTAAPMATAFIAIGQPWAANLVSIGAYLWFDGGDYDPDAGTEPCLLCHEPGPSAAPLVRQGSSALWHALPHHYHHRPYRGCDCNFYAY